MSTMKKWFFTFGCGQENGGKVQPIMASEYGKAREKMFELYGTHWCMDYSEETWNKMKNDPNRRWPMEDELPLIIVPDIVT